VVLAIMKFVVDDAGNDGRRGLQVTRRWAQLGVTMRHALIHDVFISRASRVGAGHCATAACHKVLVISSAQTLVEPTNFCTERTVADFTRRMRICADSREPIGRRTPVGRIICHWV